MDAGGRATQGAVAECKCYIHEHFERSTNNVSEHIRVSVRTTSILWVLSVG